MNSNTAKASDRAALNLKRKRDTQCVAHLNGASRPAKRDCPSFTTPTRRVVKHIKLGGNERKLANFGPGNSQRLVRYYLNYKKSRNPERLMFHQNGEWLDYPKDVVDLVKKDFETKKVAAIEVELNGNDIVLDFLHMYQMDLKTGFRQPIAWIDEAGCCFFPEVYDAAKEEPYNFCEQEGAESHEAHESNEINLHLAIEINGEDDSKLMESSEGSSALVKDVKLEPWTDQMDSGNVGEAVKKEDIDLDAYTESVKLDLDSVQKMFLTGMTSLAVTDSDIVEIYRCSGMSMQARLELFQKQAEITKGIQGDANVRYAWLAVSKRELSTMMQYGLGYCGLSASKCVYGFGVHLAALTCPYTCAPFSDVDENGVKHLVLCRVIMGNMELLQPGSGQARPRGCEYGNGVDDIQSPNCYVVWNMNVNTHIYPEFIISFKVPLVAGQFFSNESKKNVSGDSIGSHGSRDSSTVDTGNASNVGARNGRPLQSPFLPQGNAPIVGARNHRPLQSPFLPQGNASNVGARNQRPAQPSCLPFPLLFAAISTRVPPRVVALVRAYYLLFMAKKISREIFMMKLRLIVGDTLLKATIANLQLVVPSTAEWKGLHHKQG